MCSRYDPKENKWTRVASMSTRRLGVAVAVLGGFLYAVGGSDGTSPLNTGKHTARPRPDPGGPFFHFKGEGNRFFFFC